jgi:hypothetical protein
MAWLAKGQAYEKFSGEWNSYLLFQLWIFITSLFSVIADWQTGCNYTQQTKWRASGRFLKDLTARGP